MSDRRLSQLAHILVNYSTRVKPGEWVHIEGHHIAAPLIRQVVACVLETGGHPTVSLEDDDVRRVYMARASDDQLKWMSPIDRLVTGQVDVSIYISATANTRVMSAIDPARQQKLQAAWHELQETFMRRAAEGKLRWVLTQYPCQALAQEADMSLADFEDFVYQATFADQDDPVGCWQRIHTEQERLIQWLAGKKSVAIRSPHANLTLSIEGRTFINSDGDKNMPSGEVFTGPVEDSANGWVHFTYPAIIQGREVEGVRLEFQAGRVVQATADKNQDFLLKMLDTDAGARYLGEFAIGTNYGITRFTKSILYDEKIGGTFHLAVGAGYPETGSTNQSSLHWDFICDARTDSEIRVDGALFYKDGQFQV